jgi:hypothetical protein
MIIVDESLTGERLHSFTLESIEERVTTREIIRARIWQEVHEHNAEQRSGFRGFIQPLAEIGRTPGAETAGFKPIDWEAQYELALRAFESNGYFILVGDRQAESLDELFQVGAETEVSFVKFIPLVGG